MKCPVVPVSQLARDVWGAGLTGEGGVVSDGVRGKEEKFDDGVV
jgi:hypothetical protein